MKIADISIPTISKKFDEFNNLFFENKLTRPNFRINNSSHTLGSCKIPSAIQRNKGMIPTISISSYYEVYEEDMENTLIHEMCHLYQFQVIKEKMNHKSSFLMLSLKIEKLSNGKYIITRTNSRKGYKLSTEGQIKHDRLKLNPKTPIMMVCQQDNDYIWIFRLSDDFYNQIFFTDHIKKRFPSLKVLGFIYDKPVDYLQRSAVCRKKLSGIKMTLSDYKNIHRINVAPYMTLTHKEFNNRTYNDNVK